MRSRLCPWAVSVVVVCLGSGAGLPNAGLHAAGRSEEQQVATPPSQAPAGAHIYHLSAFRAAPGRLNELLKTLTSPSTPDPDAGDFAVVFRHRQGHEWDLLLVEHVGDRATISAPSAASPQGQSPLEQLIASHGDTYAAGPPLEEFRKALNLQAAAAGGQKGVYVISDYVPAAGHRTQLREQLRKVADQTPGRTVTLAHVEGAPWMFLHITRYDSWQQFAEEEEAEDAQAAKGAGAAGTGLAIREHMAIHHDTLAVVAGVVTPKR